MEMSANYKFIAKVGLRRLRLYLRTLPLHKGNIVSFNWFIYVIVIYMREALDFILKVYIWKVIASSVKLVRKLSIF